MTLNEKIRFLEQKINQLESKIIDLSANTEEKSKVPSSKVGATRDNSLNQPSDSKKSLGGLFGNPVIWNDTEINNPINNEPDEPTEGFNKHSHSRFSGGALIKDVLEIVEYVWGTITNKHSQGFINLSESKIATTTNSQGQTVKKRGQLDLTFNADTLKWGTNAYEIDIKKCYLVERDNDGDIAKDSKGQEKKSLLYNADTTKTSIVWDENGKCWRFYAVYAPEPEV